MYKYLASKLVHMYSVCATSRLYLLVLGFGWFDEFIRSVHLLYKLYIIHSKVPCWGRK